MFAAFKRPTRNVASLGDFESFSLCHSTRYMQYALAFLSNKRRQLHYKVREFRLFSTPCSAGSLTFELWNSLLFPPSNQGFVDVVFPCRSSISVYGMSANKIASFLNLASFDFRDFLSNSIVVITAVLLSLNCTKTQHCNQCSIGPLPWKSGNNLSLSSQAVERDSFIGWRLARPRSPVVA